MIQDFFRQPDGVVPGQRRGRRRLRGAALDRQHVRPLRLVRHLRLSPAASASTWCTSASAPCSTRCWPWPAPRPPSCTWPLAFVIISFYGGGFSTVPAYLRDLFGTFQVGAIHGRLLTAWSAAGIAGPLIVNAFLDAQGKPGELDAASYQPALLTMVGLLVIGFIANLMVKPVDSKFHEAPATEAGEAAMAGKEA